MNQPFVVAIILITFQMASAQVDLDSLPRKGSYLYYGQPAFEDNSFLLEEAFNQPMGVIQHTFNFSMNNLHGRDFAYSFTQEIPLTDLTHQLSYTLYYNSVLNEDPVNGNGNASTRTNGFGDLFLSYRPLLWGEKDWAMVIPRFTLILPTGKAIDGLGNGGFGGQFNLAVTKRLSRKVVTHYNAGYTFISKADKFQLPSSGIKILEFEKDLHFQNIGASIIWYPKRKFNLLLEYVSNFKSGIAADGTLSRSHQLTLNPGMRFCFDNGRRQIVPGLSMPVNFINGKYDGSGLFLYLSFEPDYLSFYKAKGQ